MSLSAQVRPRPIHRAADLLAAYLPGSYYFSSARGTLLADGVDTVVDGAPGVRASAAALALADAAALGGTANPVVIGAIGFRPDAPATLVVPSVVRRAVEPRAIEPRAIEPSAIEPSAGAPGHDLAAAGPAALRWAITPRPEPDHYTEAVRRALASIEDGALRKVVLARALELTADNPISVPALLTRLVRNDPAAHAFAMDVSAPGDPAPRTLVGASPELLVSRHGNQVVANPLAGSLPRCADDAENRRRIATLLASTKDRVEHAHTAGGVAEVLRRFCVDLDVPAEPTVIGTPTMWHLSTRITGTLADLGTSSLAIAEALHPTPAVCGVPADTARDAIALLEPEDRGYYAGLVGWTDLAGDGEWVVTIRSAEVCDRTVRMHAGAGIVAGSDPQRELDETTAKFQTLLRALGVGAQG